MLNILTHLSNDFAAKALVICDIDLYQGMFNGLDGDIVHYFTMIKIFLLSVA